jgi:iron complex outermembrane recepter protein
VIDNKRTPITFHTLVNLVVLSVTTLATIATPTVFAQNEKSEFLIEEVITVGTHIRGAASDTSAPVLVIKRSELEKFGSPSVIEIVRNLSVSSGIDGESNQFGSNALEGTSNINLRGFGAGRTLILLNGRRQTFSPRPIADQQMLFVDTNQMPSIAIERIDVLKDGAAVTYGSDAMAGVVNFVTRSHFDGAEITGSYKHIEDSDGDYDLGLIFGLGPETTHWVTSLGINHRSEIKIRDRNFALRSFANNPEGGWSLIGKPISIFSPALSAASHPVPFVADPNCERLGGVRSSFGSGASACRFQFTFFDNLVEDEDRLQLFSELKHEINDQLILHVEALYAKTDIESWNTSPSYPPQVLVDFTNRFVPVTHPGWVDMVAQFPQLTANVVPAGALEPGILPAYDGIAYVGRAFGVEGPAQEGTRNHDTYRFAANLVGSFHNEMKFDGGISYSTATLKEVTPDIQIDKLMNAILGFGGPDCDQSAPAATAGAGGCEYFNPFSNGINFSETTGTTNPSFNPAVANSEQLRNWLYGDFAVETTTELLTVDFTLSGDIDWTLAGGDIGFAAGIQYRYESYERNPNDISDLSVTPCPTPGETNCSSITGPFGFLAGTSPLDEDQDIYALYGELGLPVTDAINVQIALRFEDYGGNTGNTLDPKVSARWKISNEVTLRTSASTVFRGPTLNQLNGSFTTLSFVPAAGAFKAVESVGNPNLDPETATTFNIGIITNLLDKKLFATVDYWVFDIDDPIIVEPFEAVLATDLPNQVVRNTTTGAIEKIITNIVNGPNIKSSGVDLEIKFYPHRQLSLGFDTSYISNYDVDKYSVSNITVFEKFSPVGQLNTTHFVRPMPRIKAKAFVEMFFGSHLINLVGNYVHSYRDERSQVPGNTTFSTLKDAEKISGHFTLDFNYNYTMPDGNSRLNISVNNINDKDPPFARLDVNYDPFTHNPLGRTVKLTVSHRFGASE